MATVSLVGGSISITWWPCLAKYQAVPAPTAPAPGSGKEQSISITGAPHWKRALMVLMGSAHGRKLTPSSFFNNGVDQASTAAASCCSLIFNRRTKRNKKNLKKLLNNLSFKCLNLISLRKIFIIHDVYVTLCIWNYIFFIFLYFNSF